LPCSSSALAGSFCIGQTKTEASDAELPLVPICEAALHDRAAEQDADKSAAGADWHVSDLVFTTRTGRPIEPRNFNRSFAAPAAALASG
jgi:hypothetical protein